MFVVEKSVYSRIGSSLMHCHMGTDKQKLFGDGLARL